MTAPQLGLIYNAHQPDGLAGNTVAAPTSQCPDYGYFMRQRENPMVDDGLLLRVLFVMVSTRKNIFTTVLFQPEQSEQRELNIQ